MAFTPKSWQNSPVTTTPLSAAAMIDLETRLTNIGLGGITSQTGATYTAVAGDVVLANPASGGITITLPAPAQSTTVTVIGGSNITDGNTATIQHNSTEHIYSQSSPSGASSLSLLQAGIGVLLASDGTNWYDVTPVSSISTSPGVIPGAYCDNITSFGYANGPNFAIGSVFASISIPTAHGNTAFGIGGRSGVPTTGTLGALTSGYDNTAIGSAVGNSITTGHANTALGADALSTLATGNSNTAIGAQALEQVTGNNNVGVGNATAGGNAAAGATTGNDNTAVGYSALNLLTTGSGNTAVGSQALNFTTIKTGNTAVGYFAGLNLTADGNTAVGYAAMQGATSGATAITNSTGIGYQALTAITTGNANSALGYTAGQNVSSGGQNTLLGANAGSAITDGLQNTVVGQNAGTSLIHGAGCTVIGQAASASDVNYCTALGKGASVTGTGGVAIGTDSSGTGASAASNVIALGTASHTVAISTTTAIGNGASANLTALAKGTGGGPASDVVNAWIPFKSGTTSGFIPFFV